MVRRRMRGRHRQRKGEVLRDRERGREGGREGEREGERNRKRERREGVQYGNRNTLISMYYILQLQTLPKCRGESVTSQAVLNSSSSTDG